MYALFYTSRLILIMAVLLTAHAVKAEGNPPIYKPASCSNIAGMYSYLGVIEIKQDKQLLPFLKWLARPSLSDVQWIKITNVDNMGKFKIYFVNHLGQSVGIPLGLNTSCVDGKWEDKFTYEGSGDGSLVKGTRVWRYYCDDDGVLVVTSRAEGAIKYFPGFPWRNAGVEEGVARFSPYKND